MGWNGMRWDGMIWDEMGWDGLGWDGMEWDEMGWDGMGRKRTAAVRGIFSADCHTPYRDPVSAGRQPLYHDPNSWFATRTPICSYSCSYT